MRLLAGLAAAILALPATAGAQAPRWAASWTGSVQGPYPVGNPSAQPDMRFAIPAPAEGLQDQTLRLMVKPAFWGPMARLRFSNAFGTRPVTIDGVFAGLQQTGSVLEPRSNQPVSFGGQPGATIAPGQSVWSDPIGLPFVAAPADPALTGNRLAVSLHVVGPTGPLTWHAKALTTSYLSGPGSGPRGNTSGVLDFPFSTASWFLLDAVDMASPDDQSVVVALGDSITDGTASTLNGDDRWPDVLQQRLSQEGRPHAAVVDAGIGGNQVAGPAIYGPDQPFSGGPSVKDRLERDVLSLSGVTTVIWLEGINDFSKNGNATVAAVVDGMKDGVARIRARFPNVAVIGATVTTALGSSSPAHGNAEQDAKRKQLNAFIRTPRAQGGVFDAVADFDAATLDAATGEMKAEFVPESTTGGPGEKLHPNRAGYEAMAAAIDLDAIK